jgi:hypothetical protein
MWFLGWLGLLWSVLTGPQIEPLALGFKLFSAVFVAVIYLVVTVPLLALLTLALVMSKKHRGVVGEHELIIQEDGLLERSTFNESLHRWAGFDRIVTSGQYLYIFVTDQNVHVVPRRSFGSVGEFEVFRAELHQHMRASNPAP